MTLLLRQSRFRAKKSKMAPLQNGTTFVNWLPMTGKNKAPLKKRSHFDSLFQVSTKLLINLKN